MEKDKIKKEKIDAGEVKDILDLGDYVEVLERSANIYEALIEQYEQEPSDDLCTKLAEYEEICRMGASASDDRHWNAIAHVLRHRGYSDTVSEIQYVSFMKSKEKENIELGIAKYSLTTLIRQSIIYERLMREDPTEDKRRIRELGFKELKKRGYGGLVYNITGMNDPSDNEEINEIQQLADTEYSEGRLSECSDVYDKAKATAKHARISLYNEINTAIAIHGEVEGLSHGEIIGILELLKLQHFIKTKDQIKERRQRFLHGDE